MKSTLYRFKMFPGHLLMTTFLTLTALLLFTNLAMASTAANTAITNSVVLSYNSGGTTYTDTSSVTVNVLQVYLPPAFRNISTSVTTTQELQNVTQVYGVYALGNGSDTYGIDSTIIESIAPSLLNNESLDNLDGTSTLSTTVTLGATALARQTLSGATTLVVPAGSTTNLANSDLLIISNVTYQIASVSAATPTADFDTINLDITTYPAPLANILPGTLVGEYQEITLTYTTGTLGVGVSSGTHTTALTGTDTNNTGATSPSHNGYVVTVTRAVVSVTKEVDDGSGFVSGPINSTTGTTLTYRITVQNTSASTATNVSLVDTLSPYTAFGTSLISFTDGAPSSGLTFTPSTHDDYKDTAYSYTPVSTGGGAIAGFDATVTEWTVDFGVQTMNANSSFTLTYDVLIQ